MVKRILLVEDQAIIAMGEAAILRKNGFEVVHAYSGEKAVEASLADTEISLILMDIDLGRGIDGTVAAGKILEKMDIPIIFLTSHAEKEYVDKVKKITGYGYVLKNSGEFILIESINMAYTLFEAKEEISRHLGKQNKTVTKLETRELVLRHVNRILKSLRDINHLITHKTVRSELLSGACRTLVETSGYTRAWIVLTNRDKPVPPFYNYGFSDGFAVFGEHLLNHGMPECARRAKVSGNVEVTEDPRNQCPDCPLWHDAANECIHDQKMVTFTASLHHEQEYFGTVSVILPWDFGTIPMTCSYFMKFHRILPML